MTIPSTFALVAYVNAVAYRLVADHAVRFATMPPRARDYARARIGQAYVVGLPHASAALAVANELQRGLWKRWPMPGCVLAA